MNNLYGNLMNRLMENQNNIPTITTGMGVTEYLYSDREAYEVIDVKSQKDVVIRKLTAISKAAFSNDWELKSDNANPTKEVVYRYNNWYEKHFNKNTNKVEYTKLKLRFGVADYYYDYSF